MSQDADGAVKESDEAVYLLEVGLQPSEYGPPVYTLLLMEEEARNGKDRPLTDEDGYIVWFPEPGDAERRDRAFDAITWCIGAVAIKSRMLPRRDAGT